MIYWIDSLVSCLKDTETCVVKVPKFMQGDTLPAGYNSAPDPYSEPPVSKYNIRAMVNYALGHGKKVTDLTKEEAELFIISYGTGFNRANPEANQTQ